jgi:hypothetical protein
MNLDFNLDISTGIEVAFLLAVGGAILSLLIGISTIQKGSRLNFFRKRREAMLRGWRMILAAVILGAVGFSLRSFAAPAMYRVFPPSATITLTPTITLTVTISMTPTITLTPTITYTPAESPTPQIPSEILSQFNSIVTPNPDAIFSIIQFSRTLKDNLPVEPTSQFTNPVGLLYGTFSYDKMIDGSQWTAVWYRLSDNILLCYETKPWDGSTGGYGYTECNPSSEQWLPGDYDVQIYIGTQWIVSSRFIVTGEAATPTRTGTPTRTPTNTSTLTPSRTISPTKGPTLSQTPRPTPTQTSPPTSTRTRVPTSTMIPSWTPKPLDTRWPSQTKTP